MNNSRSLSNQDSQPRRATAPRHVALAVVLGICGAVTATAASAQATTGRIFGRAPAGDSVLAVSTDTGLKRPAEVNVHGRYTIDPLPDGMYTVVLEDHGQPVLQHLDVPVTVGSGIEVDFDCVTYRCTQVARQP